MTAGIPRNYHVIIALDEPAYKAMKDIGAQVVYLESNFTSTAVNNRHIVDYYDILKMKPTILHQLLLWDAEAILVDADVVFLENPLSIFNDEADFEVQCDSKEYYWIPTEVDPVVCLRSSKSYLFPGLNECTARQQSTSNQRCGGY